MSFYGLEISKTGLFLSQKAMQVIGQNVANANTVGYTRQRIVSASIAPASLNQRYSPIVTAAVGGGVEIEILDQVRNEYIDREIRRENSDLGMLSTKADTIEYISSLFDESADSSISSALSDFFKSISEFSTDSVSKEIRTNAQQKAIKLTDTFNRYYQQLVELQREQNENMKYTVDEINSLLTSIGDYNVQIATYELSGELANDMRDKRNVLLDELSQKVDITYNEDTNGHLHVLVQGVELVNHDDVTHLVATADQPSVVTGETNFYRINYENAPTTPFAYKGGELEAYRTMRDGNTADEVGIPRLIAQLNQLARSIAEQYNKVNEAGWTMPHDAVASQQNVDIFDIPTGGYANLTAANFKISAQFKSDVYVLAASTTQINLAAPNPQQGNNLNALSMLDLSTSNTIPTVVNFESYLKSTISELASASKYTQDMYESEQSVMDNLLNHRESVSGVSIDEEMTNLIKYQHAYQAASRMINAVDEELDVLINKTGMVGR
jgi:flagellar hook-associated protein 1 FlgK